MPNLRAAAALLTAANSSDRLVSLLEALGFVRPPLALDQDAREALGLASGYDAALLIEGSGTLRALAVETPSNGLALREHVTRIAGRMAPRSPHLLWLIAAVEPAGTQAAIAVWSPEQRAPRVTALLFDRTRVVDSDAETIAALAATNDAAAPDVLVHARWLEILGRDALGRRFYRALERVVRSLADAASGGAPATERHDVALLYVSRLLFLAFLEAKGWLDGDREFLARGYARCIANGGAYHRRVLLPLFFGTLNTPRARRAPAARFLGDLPFLNGGLFARSPIERRCRTLRFPDPELGAVFGELLSRYRFTAREDGQGWSEAAVDPEMLGKAFESLMAARDRRTSGAFYTPQRLVEHVTASALVQALGRGPAGDDPADADLAHAASAALHGDAVSEDAAAKLRMRLSALRLIDPACGSGAFLVHALEQIAALTIRLGDARPVADVRREVLARSIFGVDVNPTAVWLCELRLWLSVVIESTELNPAHVQPLPNLDRHVRVGDSLAGGDFAGDADVTAGRALTRLRTRYARASGVRKRTLARALDQAERRAATAALDRRITRLSAERGELLRDARGRDLFGARRGVARLDAARLATLRAALADARSERRALAGGGAAALSFSFAAHFADVGASGGFGVVVGNPPWVRLHNIPPNSRRRLRAEYAVFRDAGWTAGAAGASAGRGFAAQVDLAALFVERALRLLAPSGTLAFLLPAKLWRSLAGGGVRQLLASAAEVTAVEDFSEAPAAFDAAVYPSLLVARRAGASSSSRGRASAAPLVAASIGSSAAPTPHEGVRITRHRPRGALSWTTPRTHLPFADPASPWLLLPNEVRRAFDRIVRRGIPLSESPLGRPTLGVKCGCNDAFIVEVADDESHDESGAAPATLIHVRSGRREGHVDAAWLRPLIRGEAVRPWRVERTTTHIVWTHDAEGLPFTTLPATLARWLAPARARLLCRSDLRPGTPWWMLFRIEGAVAEYARVIWSDIGRAPRAAVLQPGDPAVPLNSCYVVACPETDDANALAALLNSRVAAAWLNALAEPARGGYHRYLGWTMALLPLPVDWAHARALLAPLGARGSHGDPPAAAELVHAVLDAYRLRFSAVAPLLTWNDR